MVWGTEAACSAPQMVVHANYGGVVLLAKYEGTPIGFLFSFPALYHGETVLWSHETGVLPDFLHQGIGYRLKIEQRQQAAALGYNKIAWTYDPLVSRNAFFNLEKLRANVQEYKVNVYGTDESDTINRGLETDRFVAVWPVTAVETKPEPRVCDDAVGAFALMQGQDGNPVTMEIQIPESKANHQKDGALEETDYFFTEIPRDFSELAHIQPDLARKWRLAFRNQAIPLLNRGYKPVAYQTFRDHGCYSWRKQTGEGSL